MNSSIRSTQLSAQNQQYRSQVNSLKTEVNQKEQFVTQIAPLVLPGKLAGRRVLVVSTQQSDADVKSVQSDLELAGATVTGHVTIEDNFVKPDNNGPLLDLAATTLNTNAITGLPANSDGVETSTALLAAALMNHVPAVPAAEPAGDPGRVQERRLHRLRHGSDRPGRGGRRAGRAAVHRPGRDEGEPEHARRW